MNEKPETSYQLLTLLKGTWKGEGRGQFPGVTSFDYRETLIFTRRDERTLAYEQRAQKKYEGSMDWLESHWESGFIRILENDTLELTSAQIGRAEVLIGTIERPNDVFRIHFVSKAILNDPRMLSSARTWEVEADSLCYEMEMYTTKVDQPTPHLKIALQHIR